MNVKEKYDSIWLRSSILVYCLKIEEMLSSLFSSFSQKGVRLDPNAKGGHDE